MSFVVKFILAEIGRQVIREGIHEAILFIKAYKPREKWLKNPKEHPARVWITTYIR